MSAFLEKNLALIGALAPDVARRVAAADLAAAGFVLQPAKNGEPTLLHRGERVQYLHSRYEPSAEARKTAAAGMETDVDVVVIGGFGLGYLAEAALVRGPDCRVVAVETDPAILRAACEARDLAPLLASGRFDFVLTERIDDVSLLLEDKATRKTAMLIHRPSFDLFPDFYRNLRTVLHSFLNSKEVSLATLARFERLWTRNLLRNLPYFAAAPGVGALAGRLAGVPAFVVAAGPSLSRNIDQLRAARGKGIVIAVDTVYKTLLAHGVEPDLVVAVDPQLVNAAYFRGARAGATRLVADCAVYPSLLHGWPGTAYLSAIPFPFASWFETFFGTKGGLASGGSVSTSAFDLATLMGCSPIVFVGQDLAYSESRIHVRGTAGEERWENGCDRLTPVTRNMSAFLRKNRTARVPAWNGEGEVWTDRKFLTFLFWLERRIGGMPEGSVCNATEGGARIKGAESRRLADVLAGLPDAVWTLPDPPDSSAAWPAAFGAGIERLAVFLDDVASRCARGVALATRLLSKRPNDMRDQLAELDTIDEAIQGHPDFSRLLSSTLQRVIHSIKEGYADGDGSGPDADAAPGDPEQVLEQSRRLYEEIARAARETNVYVSRYLARRLAGSPPRT